MSRLDGIIDKIKKAPRVNDFYKENAIAQAKTVYDAGKQDALDKLFGELDAEGFNDNLIYTGIKAKYGRG